MTERALVDSLSRGLDGPASPWPVTSSAREFDYGRGRADLIASTENGQVIAFEAKLDRWRDALHQAYRNRCFAHSSYVVLRRQSADRALRYADEFRLRSVGLCCVEGDSVVVLIDSPSDEPLQPWLAWRAAVTAYRNVDARPAR